MARISFFYTKCFQYCTSNLLWWSSVGCAYIEGFATSYCCSLEVNMVWNLQWNRHCAMHCRRREKSLFCGLLLTFGSRPYFVGFCWPLDLFRHDHYCFGEKFKIVWSTHEYTFECVCWYTCDRGNNFLRLSDLLDRISSVDADMPKLLLDVSAYEFRERSVLHLILRI